MIEAMKTLITVRCPHCNKLFKRKGIKRHSLYCKIKKINQRKIEVIQVPMIDRINVELQKAQKAFNQAQHNFNHADKDFVDKAIRALIKAERALDHAYHNKKLAEEGLI